MVEVLESRDRDSAVRFLPHPNSRLLDHGPASMNSVGHRALFTSRPRPSPFLHTTRLTVAHSRRLLPTFNGDCCSRRNLSLVGRDHGLPLSSNHHATGRLGRVRPPLCSLSALSRGPLAARHMSNLDHPRGERFRIRARFSHQVSIFPQRYEQPVVYIIITPFIFRGNARFLAETLVFAGTPSFEVLPDAPPYPCPFITDEEIQTYLAPLYARAWTVQPSNLNPGDKSKAAPELVKLFTFSSTQELDDFLQKVDSITHSENVSPLLAFVSKDLDLST